MFLFFWYFLQFAHMNNYEAECTELSCKILEIKALAKELDEED